MQHFNNNSFERTWLVYSPQSHKLREGKWCWAPLYVKSSGHDARCLCLRELGSSFVTYISTWCSRAQSNIMKWPTKSWRCLLLAQSLPTMQRILYKFYASPEPARWIDLGVASSEVILKRDNFLNLCGESTNCTYNLYLNAYLQDQTRDDFAQKFFSNHQSTESHNMVFFLASKVFAALSLEVPLEWELLLVAC